MGSCTFVARALLLQFRINKHKEIFHRPQITLALWARALLLLFEKSPCAYLF